MSTCNEELPATQSDLETAPPRPHQYRKRPDTNAVFGYRFEAKLLALVLFRLQQQQQHQGSFLLGWNVDGIGDFDDLVAKHKDKPDAVIPFDDVPDRKQNGAKICLKMLVDSYVKIRDQLNGASECTLFKDVAVGNVEMILYTNARVEVNQEVFGVAMEEGSGLFSSSRGQVLSLSKIGSTEELEREALRCFRIFECQANQMELEAILKAEIRNCCDGDEQYIFSSYFDQIRH